MKFVEMALHQHCTSGRFSIIQPTRTPAMVGPGYTVGQSVGGIKFPAIQVRRFIHLGDVHSKQWAVLNASSL